MKHAFLTLALLYLPFALGSCATCKQSGDQSGDQSGEIVTTPGGDCVVSFNPAGNGFGPTFQVGYQFNGNKSTFGGNDYYRIEIGSSSDTIKVGTPGGTQATLTEDETYDIIVQNLAGPMAQVTNQNDAAETYQVSVADIPTGDLVSPGFSVITRPYESGAVEYTRIAILVDNKGVFLYVRE